MTMAVGEPTATAELVESAGLWRLWSFMSWQDIRQRYRGSLIGPFWVAGGIAAASLGAGTLYARILHVDLHHLVAFIAIGVALWTLLTLTLTESCYAFVGSAGLIRNAALPRPVHVLRVVSRNLIVFAHGLIVVVLVFVFTGVPLNLGALLAIPGLCLIIINLTWAGWFLAVASARFRDVIQITVYGLQFAIFITPIFWYPQMAGKRFAVLLFNPLYHLIEVVRAPLLGYGASSDDWIWVIGMAVAGWVALLLTFNALRHEVAYWI